MKAIVTFGEIMGRLCPENFQRFRQSMPGKLDMTFAWAEANVAASCLCHSINGDFNYSSRAEVEALMKGSGSGRVIR